MPNPVSDFSFFSADADGFAELFLRLPDTSVTQFFTGLYMLDFEKRQEASQTAIAHGEAHLKSLIEPSVPRPQIPQMAREVKRLGASHSTGMALTLLKQWTGAMKSDKPGARRMSGPVNPALIAYADKFEMIAATEMRKLLKGNLAERFGLKAEKRSGGTWRYESGAKGGAGNRLRRQLRAATALPDSPSACQGGHQLGSAVGNRDRGLGFYPPGELGGDGGGVGGDL